MSKGAKNQQRHCQVHQSSLYYIGKTNDSVFVYSLLVQAGQFSMRLLKAFLLLTLTFQTTLAYASSFEEGLAAYKVRQYKRAYEIWHPLAKRGNADAQYYVGNLYANGFHVLKDNSKAVKWWQRAAEKGHGEAQTNLAVWYDLGWGAPRDPVEATKWYHKAAEQGVVDAQYELGRRYEGGYERGYPVPKDFAKATKWYRKAARQGYSDAQHNLGVMYERGQGVPKDIVEAFKWIIIAQSSSDLYPASYLRISGRMTERQVARAKYRAQEWMKDPEFVEKQDAAKGTNVNEQQALTNNEIEEQILEALEEGRRQSGNCTSSTTNPLVIAFSSVTESECNVCLRLIGGGRAEIDLTCRLEDRLNEDVTTRTTAEYSVIGTKLTVTYNGIQDFFNYEFQLSCGQIGLEGTGLGLVPLTPLDPNSLLKGYGSLWKEPLPCK